MTDGARDAALALLAARATGATICPSEVARAITPGDCDTQAWRNAMPMVHEAIDRLLDEGHVRLSWKGKPLTARSGPYRIARGHS
jgi:hypothetical protein